MSLPSLHNLSASASFRLTMIYASLFVGGMIAVLLIGGAVMIWLAQRDLREEVDEEIAALLSMYEEEKEQGLAAAIEQRSTAMTTTGYSYFLGKTSTAPMAGVLRPPRLAAGWLGDVVHPLEDDEEETLVARAVLLGDDFWLVVGTDAEDIHDTKELVVTGITWTFVVALPMALICGFMVTAMVLSRIDTITQTTNQIRRGGLKSRVPLRGNDDEFDRLSLNINKMLDSIQDLTRNIQQVSSGIAHDLRTPLSRLRNTIEAIKGRQAEPKVVDQMLDGAVDELKAVLDTFDALLRIGQIDAGMRRNGFTKLNLSELTSEVAETYDVVASASGKILTADIEANIHMIGDRQLLVQMIANVLENAIEHTPEGTRISCTLRERPGGPSMIVADDGPGIPAVERNRVFERFYRLDQSRGSNGSGLGLSLVTAIAKLHDAKVTLGDNNPGLRLEIAFAGS